MMKESLLYKLTQFGIKPEVTLSKSRFTLAFQSKDWVADPKNRICDAPGSWYCSGQYPPALQKVLGEKKDFEQLEDFNKEGDDAEYQAQYHENLAKRKTQSILPSDTKDEKNKGDKKKPWKPMREVDTDEISELNNVWEDNEATTILWKLISDNNVKELLNHLAYNPEDAHRRSSDGRGPMWWAHEYGRGNVIKVLKKLRVSSNLKDARGMTPHDEL